MGRPRSPARESFAEVEVAQERCEAALRAAVASAIASRCPPRLAAALENAVFAGGGRLRPTLCIASAIACGDGAPAAADAAAAAVELLHCASLVHDDLPCFDDADTRRGRPSLHKVFGEPMAVLTGDALIVLAFETLGVAAGPLTGSLVRELARAGGARGGLAAGQAWETERNVPIFEYHRAKTASLFEAAAAMGAIAGGGDPAPWRRFGTLVGRAYQAADDLVDNAGDPRSAGKPVGRDQALARPNLVLTEGVFRARARLESLVAQVSASIPAAPGSVEVRRWVARFSRRVRDV